MFEIAKTATGYATTPTTLVSFNTTNGAFPIAGLLADAAGNLFGTTNIGGTNNAGTVFEVVKTANGYASTPTTLVSFDTTSGANPFAGLIADSTGNLFGTTNGGGVNSKGTVFEITNSGFVVACYARGTRIATPDGERPVETLAAGDRVLTVSGEARPVVWTGHRRVACDRHPNPEAVWPVRIAAGAFGDGLPRRDLFVSPDHALFADGVLIPAKCL